MSGKLKPNKPRNPVARNLYQNKGGAHEKSKKAKRAVARQETRNKVSEWHSRSDFFSII